MSTDPSTAARDSADVTADAPADTGPAEVPARGGAGPSRRARRHGGRRRLVPVLVAALVLALAAAGWLGWQVRQDNARDEARGQAIAAAQVYAVNLTTYNHETLEQDFARVIDNATGSFRSEYTAASQELRELIVKYKATATGRVISTGVVRSDTGGAELLLFVDQTVKNTNSDDPRIDRSRMQMGLQKEDGRWLISSLELL